MQSQIVFVCAILLVGSCFSQSPLIRTRTPPEIQLATVRGLISRTFGEELVSHFQLEILPPSDTDVFQLLSQEDKIVIRGTSGVALSSGFNWYLKYYCNCHISWGRNGTGNQLNLPFPLPKVETQIEKTSLGSLRYYMNVCTLSYSAAWWDWTRWEREIDWMALNGINMPLAFTGQEYIWEQVFTKLGLTNKEIDDFFCGPAFLAWNRMGNIKQWGGPLPPSWRQAQANLQKAILKRQRDFGMIPVLPAFAGHVPDAITRIFPKANVSASAEWAGFKPPYSGILLVEPLDPLFQLIGKLYLDTQTSVYGTDHIYNADTYNEMEPHSKDPNYLALSSASVYNAMATSDPAAVWLMQGWLFLDTSFWGPAQVQGYLSGVSNSSMIILDLDSLSAPQWSRLSSYYGKPWIWCLLHNFGGNRRVYGDLPGISTVPLQSKKAPGSTMIGTGMTPEAIEQNPIVYELMSEITWYSSPVTVDDWVQKYAFRRYGLTPNSGPQSLLISAAWKSLLAGVYSLPGNDESSHSAFELAPTLEHHIDTVTDCNISLLLDGARSLVAAGNILPSQISGTGPFLYDVVDVVRQVLADFFYDLYGQLYFAYHSYTINKKDTSRSVTAVGSLMITLLNDLDSLLASNPNFMLGLWINDTLSWAQDETEKTLYNFNARNQITLWGPTGEINDYAAKHWAGLVGTYHVPRWTILIQTVLQAIKAGGTVDWQAYHSKLLAAEQAWNKDTSNNFPLVPEGDTIKIATALLSKYTTSKTVYIATPNTDAPGNDMQQAWTKDLAQLKLLCSSDPACVGFNSNGWMKNALSPLQNVTGATFFTKQTKQ